MFYLTTHSTHFIYGYIASDMVKDHSNSERENPLSPHRLIFPISIKGSFICIIPQTGYHIPRPGMRNILLLLLLPLLLVVLLSYLIDLTLLHFLRYRLEETLGMTTSVFTDTLWWRHFHCAEGLGNKWLLRDLSVTHYLKCEAITRLLLLLLLLISWLQCSINRKAFKELSCQTLYITSAS